MKLAGWKLIKIFTTGTREAWQASLLYLDDEINPKDVYEDESAPFSEESPGSKKSIAGGSKSIEGAAYQPVQYTAKLEQDFINEGIII